MNGLCSAGGINRVSAQKKERNLKKDWKKLESAPVKSRSKGKKTLEKKRKGSSS